MKKSPLQQLGPDAQSRPSGRERRRSRCGTRRGGPPLPPARDGAWYASRHERVLLPVAATLLSLAIVMGYAALTRTSRPLTQDDIDAAVLHTLETVPTALPRRRRRTRRCAAPSSASTAPAMRRNRKGDAQEGIGTGVVIVDTGIILTNMHVVAGADRIQVEFDDGFETEATVVGVRPEHDLAVLQANKLPDDLPAATLRSTADLAAGDEVIAVGFPVRHRPVGVRAA